MASSWYLEVRSRRCIPYEAWADDSVRRVTDAVLAGESLDPAPLDPAPLDAAPLDAALADLGAARARAGFDEQDLADDLDALTAVAPLPLVSAELLGTSLAGWREAATPPEAPSRGPDAGAAPPHIDLPAEERKDLDRELAALLAASSDGDTTGRVVVIDVDHGTAPDHGRVVAALERLSAARFPQRRWLTLHPEHRYGFVVHDRHRATHALAALRADLRTAPELSDARVWIWMEELPRDPAGAAAFVRGLAGAAPVTTAAHDDEAERSRAATHHPPRGARLGSTRTRRRRVRAFEHLTGAMGLALVAVLVAGSLGIPSDDQTPSDVTLPDGSLPPATPVPDSAAEAERDATPRSAQRRAPAPSPTREAPERDATPTPSEPGDDEVVLDEPQPISETSPAPEPAPSSDEPPDEPAGEEPPTGDGDLDPPDAPSSTGPEPTDTVPGHAHAPATGTPGPPDHATPGGPGEAGDTPGSNGSGVPGSSPASSGPDVGSGPPSHAAVAGSPGR